MFSPVGVAAIAVWLVKVADAMPAAAAAVAISNPISTSNSSTETLSGSSSHTPGGAIKNSVPNPYDSLLFPFNIVPANPSLASFCSSSFLSEENQYFSTAALFSWTDPAYTYRAANDHSSTITVAAESGVEYSHPWTFKASTPCCLDCTLFGGSIQVYYWPSTTSSGAASTMVVSDKTFTSPSIYVEFQSLQATDYCGPVASGYTTPHVLAFDPTELSTAMAWTYNAHEYVRPLVMNNTWSQGQWSTLSTCENMTTTLWSLDSGGFTTYSNAEDAASSARIVEGTISQTITGPLVHEYVLTYNPCSPSLSVPTQLFTINPSWQSCKQGLSAFHDPPSALTPAAGPRTTASNPSATLSPGKETTTSAVPGPTITPTIAHPTASVSQNTPAPTPIEDSSPSTVLVGPSTTIVLSASEVDPLLDTTPNANSGENPPIDTHTGVIITPSAPAVVLPTFTHPSNISISAGSPPSSIISLAPTPNSNAGEVPPVDTHTGVITTPSAPAMVLPTLTKPNDGSISVASPLSSIPSVDATPNSNAGEVPPLDTNTGVIVTPTAPALVLPTFGDSSETAISAANPQDDSSPTSVNQIDTTQPAAVLPEPTISHTVGTQDLNPGGPAITVSGVVVSLVDTASVVVDGTTEALSSVTTAAGGLGGFIATIGGFAPPSTTVTAGSAASSANTFNGTSYVSEGSAKSSNLLLLGGLGFLCLLCS